MLVEAQAPGKLVIVGEYAVLEGAPGLAVAVDVRATARIATTTGRHDAGPGRAPHLNQLVIPESGVSCGFRFVPGAEPRWEGTSPGAFGLPLTACVGVLACRGLLPSPSETPPCRIELESGDFHQTAADGRHIKLGVGSSAAIVVALMGALLRWVGHALPGRDELIELCHEGHHRLQGGTGSGIDVATSLAGGVVAIKFNEPPRRPPSRAPRPPGSTPLRVPQAEPVAWPRHLRLVAAWSGESASTPAMLGRLRAFREKDPAGFDSHMGRLGANAGRAVAAWADDDMAALLTAIDGYESGLRQLDEAARIGIFSPAHERLREIARRHGAVYKPSGAGGGDFGIAVTDSPEVERALRRAYVDAGVPLLDVELCAPGLRVRGG